MVEVALSGSSSTIPGPHVIAICKCWFWREGKIWVPGKKLLGARARTNSILNPNCSFIFVWMQHNETKDKWFLEFPSTGAFVGSTRLYEESVICKVACASVDFQFKRTSCSADRHFPNWASQAAPLTLTKEIPLIINIIIFIVDHFI